jgi:sporulation protein YlmC with PRC-barrel domain
MVRFLLTACAASALVAVSSAGLAQQATGSTPQPSFDPKRPDLTGEVSALSPEAVYKGWRSRQLLGQPAAAKDDRTIGTVRDIIVDKDGRAAALIIEGGGTIGLPDAVYRIPWGNVDLTPGRDGVQIDLSSGERPQYGLFPGTEGAPTLPREFRVTEVIGDYARLKTGYGYGLVTDAVFAPDGRMIAVLVSRDASSGGGTVAFSFSGASGGWDPGANYFGLPFVTEGQAREAGLRIEARRFAGTL